MTEPVEPEQARDDEPASEVKSPFADPELETFLGSDHQDSSLLVLGESDDE